MKKIIIGLIGMILIGCGGNNDNNVDLHEEFNVTCINSEDNIGLISRIKIENKSITEIMEHLFIKNCFDNNKCTIENGSNDFVFYFDGTVETYKYCINNKAGDIIPNTFWVYQD